LHHAGVTDIELCRDSADLPGKCRGSCNIEVSDYDVGAGIGKASHNRRTNSLRAARDKRATAIEPPEWPGANWRHV
jgi:hypothetical protein